MPDTNAQRETSPPPPPSRPLASWYVQGLSDGLGDRLLMFDNSEAPSLELLRFRPDVAQAPGFETALRDQVKRLAGFHHPAFARVRSVQRLEPDDDLALISNCTPGKRLSEVLQRARGPAFAAALIRQLAPALALFQQHAAGISHGTLNPDRIVVSPEGRLTIVEHVVGPAVDTLNLRPAQLAALGIAFPPASGDAAPRLGAAADWYQLGLVAVSVLIGRPIAASELPQLETLLDGLAYSAHADGGELSPFIRQWLDRALHISGEPIESSADARAALDEMLRREQPRDTRRLETSHRDETTAPAAAVANRVELTREAVAVTPHVSTTGVPDTPAVSTPAVRAASDVATTYERSTSPTEFRPVEPAAFPAEPPAARRSVDTSIFEVVRPTAQARPRQAQVRPFPTREPLSLFEQETLAARERLLDIQRGAAAAYHQPSLDPPHARAADRKVVSLIAALALIAVVEAGVIAWQVRARWLAPDQPLVVETTASGESVVLPNGSAEQGALAISVAPDLRWVRVTEPSTDALGTKAPTSSPGAIRISTPIALKVFEGTRLLGSVPGADLKLAAGRHDLALVNAELGYRLQHVLNVEAGQTIALHVAPQHGWVTIDATPWAEVAIDGRAAGRTPLGPLPLALGEHQITFQHPAGSKDRQKVTVKSGTTTRVTGIVRF